jgi:hypothetical protein
MTKWVNKALFDKYVETKEKEEEEKKPGGMFRSNMVWRTPQAGTVDKPKVYEGRFLPDKKGNFTKKYYYHMFRTGETWVHYLCPKTENFSHWCPMCSITSKLYMGTQKDKTAANNYKRKVKHAGNFYIIDDPRDAEAKEPNHKVANTLRIYEFPDKVESKVKMEITDKREGLGYKIFDPGEEGYNFILKVKSTKPDQSGKTYPDYSDSVFSRKASALGSDADIKKIMETTFDLDEYIQSLKIPIENLITALKTEMLWDMIESDWTANMGRAEAAKPVKEQIPPSQEEDIPNLTPPEKIEEVVQQAKMENKKDAPKKGAERTQTDEELLRELDKI